MAERRIFRFYGMKNASIFFWRPLSDSLDSKLSPKVGEKSIYVFFYFLTAEKSVDPP